MELRSHKKARCSSTSPSVVGLRLDELFDELLLMLLGYMVVPDIGRFARVCRRFAALACEDSVWRPQVALLTCRSVDELSKPEGCGWRRYFERLAVPVAMPVSATAPTAPVVAYDNFVVALGGCVFILTPGVDIVQYTVAEPAADEQPWILVRRVQSVDFKKLRPFGDRLVAVGNNLATVFDAELNRVLSFALPAAHPGDTPIMFPVGSRRTVHFSRSVSRDFLVLDSGTGGWTASPYRLPQPRLLDWPCVTKQGIAVLVDDVAGSCASCIYNPDTTRQLRVVELDEGFSIIKSASVAFPRTSGRVVCSTVLGIGGQLMVIFVVNEFTQAGVHVYFQALQSGRSSSWETPLDAATLTTLLSCPTMAFCTCTCMGASESCCFAQSTVAPRSSGRQGCTCHLARHTF
eukprot:TRINITY_DN3785_c0_g4_i1.p1 TRINITY_DN3785_c0_g4~~TRINITY_DN3785_c0_g4_i1.p1  ORF type:complete len:416 (+),score=30.66 TRINITY_DN3785_c0_g4_i1:35-1249(+)